MVWYSRLQRRNADLTCDTDRSISHTRPINENLHWEKARRKARIRRTLSSWIQRMKTPSRSSGPSPAPADVHPSPEANQLPPKRAPSLALYALSVSFPSCPFFSWPQLTLNLPANLPTDDLQSRSQHPHRHLSFERHNRSPRSADL